jgi:hypothetical protein
MATRKKSSRTAKKSTISRRAGKQSSRGSAQPRRSTTGRSRATAAPHRRGSESKTTTDHDEIRKWAEGRGGVPATVSGTKRRGEVGVIRIDFPNGPEPSLEHISWDEWFDKFDENGLALVYQEKTEGQLSRFNKIVRREAAGSKGRPRRPAPKTRAAGSRGNSE